MRVIVPVAGALREKERFLLFSLFKYIMDMRYEFIFSSSIVVVVVAAVAARGCV